MRQQLGAIMLPRLLKWIACALAAAFTFASVFPVRAAEPASEPVILVAKPQLRDRIYGATILIVTPIGNNRHIGFIVNKPTALTLGKLFPEHGPSHKVADPVYLGGPTSPGTLFALVKRAVSPGANAVQLMPDLFLVLDRDLVDRVIEADAPQARFFAGMVQWRQGELNAELRRGLWYVLAAETSLVMRKPTDGMWEELVKRSERDARMIRAGL